MNFCHNLLTLRGFLLKAWPYIVLLPEKYPSFIYAHFVLKTKFLFSPQGSGEFS